MVQHKSFSRVRLRVVYLSQRLINFSIQKAVLPDLARELGGVIQRGDVIVDDRVSNSDCSTLL